ncbi:hypothetical protein [Burkholderia ubonensis]|uniref:hypothetical protein n=1 Tax=Burkholderia ubonensis TaxID=101571 RepID=UPI0007527FB6|nr:hypothetical protein [Burkholderia ubonensis]KVD70311.1 hypothetical protein WI88_30310 [Burkholderia ubonensis]
MQKLLAAKKAYDEDNGNTPIRLSDYIAALDAFESVVVKLRVPDSYETDFRRNLPAGGWRGLEVAPTLEDRIDDVRAFVRIRPVYSPAGAALLANMIACTQLCAEQGVDVQGVMSGLEPMLVRVGRGELREENDKRI